MMRESLQRFDVTSPTYELPFVVSSNERYLYRMLAGVAGVAGVADVVDVVDVELECCGGTFWVPGPSEPSSDAVGWSVAAFPGSFHGPFASIAFSGRGNGLTLNQGYE
jgi:hypothetical protein